jgi:hypothetical protein
MKSISALFLSLCLLFPAMTQTTPSIKKDLYSYILKIQLPSGMSVDEAFCGFYKGKPIEFDKNWALLPEDGEALAFSVLITPEVGFKTQGNNVRYMHRLEDKPFCWYDLTLELTNNKQIWHIKKLDPQDAPLQLPDHTIILLLEPSYIEKVIEPTAVACIKKAETRDPSAPRIMVLPTIVINQDVDEDDLCEACVYAQLAAVELRAIHKKPAMEIKKEQLAVIALCNPS